ncbi:unnamed protein product, partial [Thelazia callipaeda]|uniref:Thyroglobulin type-1 domain-containing protein n=1 Tax=Thelazia callipaeda TaxID=103827 RepID=A0A0N5D7L8_THECL
ATVEENEYEQEDEQGGYEESSTREFVETHNKVVKCDTHEVCYDYREPQTWCKLEEHQQWTDKGCFCDEKLKSCIIERKSGNKLQYANCAPSHNWDCADDDDNDD